MHLGVYLSLEELESHSAITSCGSYTSLVLCNLLHASITWQMHINHEPIIVKYIHVCFFFWDRLENSDLEISDLENSDLKNSDPLKNDSDFKRSFTWMTIVATNPKCQIKEQFCIDNNYWRPVNGFLHSYSEQERRQHERIW